MTRLRTFAALAMVCASGLAFAAEIEPIPKARYPVLAKRASAVEGFVPAGWSLEARAEGDLDGDGVPDVAFVLHGKDPALVVKNDGLGADELDTNPRILAVALRRGDRFELAAQNKTLIPRLEDPVMDDPFEGDALEIKRGTLRVSLRLFMSAGGWTTFRSTFTFRLDEGRKLNLIGFDKSTFERNTGEGKTVSANLLIGRARIETERDGRAPPAVRWRSVPKRALPIEALGNGLDFNLDPEG
jgi:hypothetical protein